MRRYAELLWVQVRASLATSMAYRVDFLIDGLMSLWWVIWSTAPLLVVFQVTDRIGDWTFHEALLVTAWFTLLRGILEGAINPSLLTVSEAIRTGTLDFTLIKPVDAQFLVSTSRFQPWKLFDVAAAIVMMAFALAKLGAVPGAGQILLAVLLTVAALLILYSIWILVVCAAFWVVRLDNLAYLFSSIFDFARWPSTIFRGTWRVVFTFVIPLALMTTYPAAMLLDRLDEQTAVLGIAGALAFAAAARLIWLRAIGHYTSASS